MSPSRSSSTSSSTSRDADMHNIFIKLLSGETIPITVPSSTPISHVQHLLSIRTSLPASSIKLVYAGRHLTASSSPPSSPIEQLPQTLSSLSIPTDSTLHMLLPILGGTGGTMTSASASSTTASPADISAAATTTGEADAVSAATSTTTTTTTPTVIVKKPARRRCTFKTCKSPPQPIVGDCSFCQGHYCGKHRMLEDHKCSGLEDCKQEAHERNKEVLEGGKTVALRGI